MPSTLNRPVDHMFRAGQISSKEWKRLSGKTQGWGQSRKMKAKMADFDAKEKDEAGVRQRGNRVAFRGHIDGPDQGASAPGAFSQPTRDGFVHGNTAAVSNREINEPSRQRPMFPGQGSGKRPKATYRGQQPASSDNSGAPGRPEYGEEPNRRARPQRLKVQSNWR